MRRADENVGIMKQLPDARAGLVTVQCDTGKGLEGSPVIAPTRAADNIQRCPREPLCTQRAQDSCRRDEIFSWFHGSQRHQPQRLRFARGALFRFEIEYIANRRPIERNRGVGPAMGREFLPGVAGIGEEVRVAP